MLEKITQELHCLERQGKNFNVWKEKTRITRFVRIGSELEG